MHTRRSFLKTGSLVVASTAIPYRATAAEVFTAIEASLDLRGLTAAALDAAKGAGATYADAHFRFTRIEDQNSLSTSAGFSVRALVNGYWGFAALSGMVTLDNAARIGRDAASQAKTAAKGKSRPIDLAPILDSANGSWVMPIEIDPFTISLQEKSDFFNGIHNFIKRQRNGIETTSGLNFIKEERTFASTDGAYTTQTVYQTGGGLTVFVPELWETETASSKTADFLSVAGAGWEYIRNASFQDKALEMIEQALRTRKKKPVDVGRYDIVFDSLAMAHMVGATIGAATELDRAFGYEANNAGTSYITDPAEMIGTLKMGSPLLSVTTNRSMPGGAATVKWDDEGVAPGETTLIKNGILTDFQTSRESASWIADYYKKAGVAVRSNGCAGQYTPISPITQVNPNMAFLPGVSDISFEDMIKDTKKGLAIVGGNVNTDHQALNGTGYGEHVYEVVDGKLGSAIVGAQYLFRAPDFWKNLVAIGGKNSVRHYGMRERRYDGNSAYTISAVPGKVTSVAVTDVKRRA